MTSIRTSVSLSTVFLVYLMGVLALGAWGGVGVGVAAGLAASVLENYYFVLPRHTFKVARPDDVVALVAFLVFAVAASVLVGRFTQRSAEAERARGEAQILAQAAASVATSHEDLVSLLDSMRAVYNATGVAVLAQRAEGWAIDVASGESSDGFVTGDAFPIDENHRLIFTGATLDAQDRDLIGAFAGRVAASLRSQVIAHDSAQFEAFAEAASLRRALFRTAATDLRGPIEEIQATVASLRRAGAAVAPGQEVAAAPRSKSASSDSTAWSPTWSTRAASRRARSRRRARRSRSPTWSTRPWRGSTRASAASRSRSRPTRASSSPTATSPSGRSPTSSPTRAASGRSTSRCACAPPSWATWPRSW